MSDTDLNLLFSSIAAFAALLYLASGVVPLNLQAGRLVELLAIVIVFAGILTAILLWLLG